MIRLLLALTLFLTAIPALAIECIRSATPVTPVMVLQRVDVGIDGIDDEQFREALRERLLAGGLYRVAYPDQYRHALSTGKIDRCTPTIGVDLTISADRSDPGAAYGLGGFVTRFTFTAKARVELLPDEVSVDSVVLQESADSVVSSKKAKDALARLIETLIKELESNRDAWTRSDTPGF